MRSRRRSWPHVVSPVHVRRSAYLGEGSNAGEASTSEAGAHLEALRQKRHGPSRYFSERAGTFAESLAGESTGVRVATTAGDSTADHIRKRVSDPATTPRHGLAAGALNVMHDLRFPAFSQTLDCDWLVNCPDAATEGVCMGLTSMSRFKERGFGGWLGKGKTCILPWFKDGMHLMVVCCIHMIHEGVLNSFSL